MTVSQADFTQFLAANQLKDLSCYFCGNRQFFSNVSGSDDKNPAEIRMHVGSHDQLYHSMYSASCSKCGYTLFFHETRILDWLLNKKGGDQ